MRHIDEGKLETDLGYRFGYLAEFMGFGHEDVEAIHAMAPQLGPMVPALVDAIYDKLHTYDATWRHFVPRQSGYEGEIPERLEDLELNHPQVAFRKAHLARYVEALVTRAYDAKMLSYLDMVGKMHTPKAGSAYLDVPLVQMNALMGFLGDTLTNVIMSLNLPRDIEIKTVRAFSKLLWLQNDMINRHYQQERLPEINL
jgi:hypothetical protein